MENEIMKKAGIHSRTKEENCNKPEKPAFFKGNDTQIKNPPRLWCRGGNNIEKLSAFPLLPLKRDSPKAV